MWLFRSLLVSLEEVFVLAVALGLELVGRDETERRGVHAVTLAGRRRTVIEDMPEVRVRVLRADLGAGHEELAIRLRHDVRRLEWFGEARPAGAALEFIE